MLPDATTSNYSGFGLIQYTFFDKLKMQMGLRYDQKSIKTEAVGFIGDTSSYRAPLEKSYGSISGSLGATHSLTDDILIRVKFCFSLQDSQPGRTYIKGTT